MKKVPLTQTNPYLRDPKKRSELNEQAVRSSCGVEGMEVTKKTKVEIERREKRLSEKLRAKLSSG